MFEPVRGGTRGGQAQFKWSDVSADKDREHYLGHSVNAPTGRWQKNKDIHWYNRDAAQTREEREEELRQIKEAEAEALSVALGFAPSSANGPSAAAAAAAAPPPPPPSAEPGPADDAAEQDEKRRRRAARRAEKEARRAARHGHGRARTGERRSRSPHRERDDDSGRRRRWEMSAARDGPRTRGD